MTPERAYDNLLCHLREMALVESMLEVLAWDEQTLLPDAASEHRGSQLAHLAGRHHALAIDARIDEWLAAIELSPLVADPHSPAAVNVREARRQHQRLSRQPRSLIEELARVTTAAQHHWKLARAADDYRLLEPWLAAVVTLKREQARCLADGPCLYDPLLAEYEPGLRTGHVAAIFDQLRRELALLLPEVLERQARSPAAKSPRRLHGIALLPLPVGEGRGEGLEANGACQNPHPNPLPQGEGTAGWQLHLCRQLATQLGFDFRRGQLDLAVHPFSTHLGPHDIRMAIRCDERDLRESIYALLHETGHALYDQGLPSEHFGTSAGDAISLGVHESQARLWEIAVGRSRGFWRFFLPQVATAFPAAFSQAQPDELWREVNLVQPGPQRVGADEVTYNLHIILRFELEQALLSGDLTTCDLPVAWNERMQALLGVTPQSDLAGCLQDGHWPTGMFGYFPTYTIGNVLAAQLFQRASAELGDLDAQFAAGNFRPIRDWLATVVYRHGKRLTTAELCQQVCGSPLDPHVFIASLRHKHAALWVGDT